IQSSKTTDEISRQSSTEESYAQEFADTTQEETSHKDNTNFKINAEEGGGINIDIFNAESKIDASYENSTEDFHKQFQEVSRKSAAKTDRKFDLHVDMKSKQSVSTRSTRQIRNFNQCQTVTYHYFQIARKYLNELRVTDVRFSQVPDNLPDV